MENEIKLLYSKVLKSLSIWGSQSYWRSLIIILAILIFGIPLVGYLQDQVRSFAYISFSIIIFSFLQKTFVLAYYLVGLGFVIVGIIFYWILRLINRSRVIKDKFKEGLTGWALPLSAGWTIQRCTDKLGKMLSVTNSTYPAILKEAYWWYDYEVSFETKIEKGSRNPNFAVVIRSESNFDGIMLQITRSQLRPHFIYKGTFIVDTDAEEQLPTVLAVDEWIKVKLIVKGNNVAIFIDGYELQYKIRTYIGEVTNDLLSGNTVTLDEIKKSNAKVTRIKEVLSMPDSETKNTLLEGIGVIPGYSTVILEYQKGSVGFREAGREKAHFRDFKIKRI
ncbi:MAG TPA: hypothetical protein VLG12_06905 [Candidatus Saccharimonadales bacterium]|nr:hypothetical protein [Candidatus Saccharimonadales bacterium]